MPFGIFKYYLNWSASGTLFFEKYIPWEYVSLKYQTVVVVE